MLDDPPFDGFVVVEPDACTLRYDVLWEVLAAPPVVALGVWERSLPGVCEPPRGPAPNCGELWGYDVLPNAGEAVDVGLLCESP